MSRRGLAITVATVIALVIMVGDSWRPGSTDIDATTTDMPAPPAVGVGDPPHPTRLLWQAELPPRRTAASSPTTAT